MSGVEDREGIDFFESGKKDCVKGGKGNEAVICRR